MKIALVILHADAARGGAERYTLDLAEALVKRGHDVSVLASSFQSQPIAGRAVAVETRGFTRTARYKSFLNALDRLLSASRFDVVHAMLPVRRCNVYHPHAGIAGDLFSFGHLRKSGRLNRLLAWVGNHTNSRRSRFAAVEKQLLNSANPPVVLCLSDLIQDVVRRTYPNLPADRLVWLFNGIDLCRFDPALRPEARRAIRDQLGISQDAIVALLLAHDFERKGLRQAIVAMARQSDSRMLLLVGGKPDPARYRKLANSLKLSDRILFAGPVHDPVGFYATADFFVLPTRFDPCSLVVLEALAMGLPVISTAQNGACEVMQDQIQGRVLNEADNIEELSEAFDELAQDHRRAAMSRACVGLRPGLSQASHVDRLEAIYRRVPTYTTA